MTKAIYFLLLLIVVVTMSCAKKGDTTTIPSGFDLFRTDRENTFFSFEKMPIPAGFFGVDSQPYTGTIKLTGGILPSSYFNGKEITQVDTIVKREQPVALSSSYPASGKISVEMTALSLIGEEPIKVQVGNRTELWDVQVELSKHRPSKGTMTITKTDAEGGSFDSQMTVYPVFRFTRLIDGEEKLLDTGTLEMTQEMRDRFTLRATQVTWRHTPPQGALVIKGMNNDFFPATTARFIESGDICGHAVRVPTTNPDTLSCSVAATRKDLVPSSFRATGTTSPFAKVNIHLVQGDCSDANLIDPFLPETTADSTGKFTFAPPSTIPSTIPGVGKQVLVRVAKGGQTSFCCTRVVESN